MDAALFKQLLHEEESVTLDCKREQYRFAKASDDDKSELLKDIVGLANAWKRSDAFILIGVEDVRGGLSNVVGITTAEHLDDHSLQQFVNNLTNRPVRFRYEAFSFEGKQVGIIKIDEQQTRPLYLKKDYGKLEKDKVYIRRGSSTDPTKPASIDEIADMGRSSQTVTVILSGLALEIEYNLKLSIGVTSLFQNYIQTYGLGTNVEKPNPVPVQRFRLQAVEAYLRQPFLAEKIPTNEVEAYWERASNCNAMMDKVVGLTTVAVVDQVVGGAMQLIPDMNAIAEKLAHRINGVRGP